MITPMPGNNNDWIRITITTNTDNSCHHDHIQMIIIPTIQTAIANKNANNNNNNNNNDHNEHDNNNNEKNNNKPNCEIKQQRKQ